MAFTCIYIGSKPSKPMYYIHNVDFKHNIIGIVHNLIINS